MNFFAIKIPDQILSYLERKRYYGMVQILEHRSVNVFGNELGPSYFTGIFSVYNLQAHKIKEIYLIRTDNEMYRTFEECVARCEKQLIELTEMHDTFETTSKVKYFGVLPSHLENHNDN